MYIKLLNNWYLYTDAKTEKQVIIGKTCGISLIGIWIAISLLSQEYDMLIIMMMGAVFLSFSVIIQKEPFFNSQTIFRRLEVPPAQSGVGLSRLAHALVLIFQITHLISWGFVFTIFVLAMYNNY